MEFNLADLFEQVADAVPDRTALCAEDRTLTYRELDQRVVDSFGSTETGHSAADPALSVR